MSLDAQAPARASTAAVTRLARVRRGSLAVLVLIVVEYAIGMYVNLYVALPRADHGASVGSAIAHGPTTLTMHAIVGALLGLGALGVLAAAIMARHPAAIASSAAGLLALAIAAAAGASFTSSGQPADSMAMSVLTGVGLLSYAASLYWLRPPPSPRG